MKHTLKFANAIVTELFMKKARVTPKLHKILGRNTSNK